LSEPPRQIEAFFLSECSSLREIAIAPNGRAIAVPDFSNLKSRYIVNTAKEVRFDMEGAAQKLAPEDRPVEIIVRASPLPRRAGEVDRELLADDPLGTEAQHIRFEPQVSWQGTLVKLIREFKPDTEPSLDDNLELELGFDSLERVQLVSAVEKTFHIDIPDDDAAGFFTFGDVLRYLEPRIGNAASRVERPGWHDILSAPLSASEERYTWLVISPRPMARGAGLPFWLLLRLFVKLLFRITTTGRHHVPKQEPFAICVNHVSHLDPLFLACGLPLPVTTRLFFLGFSDYFATGRLAWMWRLLRVVPVDSDRRARSGLRLAREGLAAGLVTCVFPEGARSADGRVHAFDQGLAVLLRETNVPVLPAAIVGSYEVLPRNGTRVRLHPVQIRFGETIRPPYGDTVTGRLENAVRSLLPAEMR
jgi:long-chain acyl-CoA synthetase